MTAAPVSNDPSGKEGSEMPPLSRELKLSLMAMVITGFLDLVGYMAIMPTLIFYIRELGGNDSQYGLVMAANSFAAFLCVPLYGSWVDHSGNKYRATWFFGQTLCILGMLVYTFAIVFGDSPLAFHVLLLSRLMYGCGAASNSTGFTYITQVVEPEQLTFCQLLLSCGNFAGLAFGPFANTLLAGVSFDLHLFGLTVPINDYNGVGLLIAANELIATILLYFFLPEPPEKKREEAAAAAAAAKEIKEGGWGSVFKEISSFQLFLPLFAVFVLSANYQLVEASFSPAASHGLGWGPVQVSAVMGFNSVTLTIMTFVCMAMTTTLKVPDTSMVIIGFVFWVVAGLMMDQLWLYPAKAWHFVVPITIALLGFPMIGPANQSTFSKAIISRPELEPIQARLQSMMSMTGEVASVVTPIFVGAFVLRSPEVVENGDSNHELTPFALYIPIFSSLCILGFLYKKFGLHDDDDDEEENETDDVVSESTALISGNPKSRRSSIATINSMLSDASKAKKMRSSSIMGGNHKVQILIPYETASEMRRSERLAKDKKFWEGLVEEDKAAVQAEEGVEAVLEPEKTDDCPTDERATNKKLLVLISSFTSNPNDKSAQDRALTILKGMKIGPDQMETIDGADAANRERRNELFGLSGVRAKYPQFFLVDGTGTTSFFADWDNFQSMHEMGMLTESMNL